MRYLTLSFCLLFITTFPAWSQPRTIKMSLDEVIEIAKGQSTQALQAKHTFRSSYWQYRSYRAEFLPSLVFSGRLPNFNHEIRQISQNDGTYKYQQVNSNTLYGALSVEQNVPLTGGTFSINTSLQRYDQFSPNKSTAYSATPISVSYSQSIFGVNQLKWDKKIEPLKYEESRRRYLKSMEGVSTETIRYFFNLASAQQNLAMAELNFTNNEELYKIAGGRYGIGTIGENDLLQSELNYMNSRASLNDAKLNLANAKNRLRSFLGYNEGVDIEIIIPDRVPNLDLDLDKVMELARKGNPDLMSYQRQVVEAEKNVASQKASRFNADISVEFGLNPQGQIDKLGDVYRDLKDKEVVGLNLRIPILDWGKGKGRVKMAKSNLDLARVQYDQQMSDFEQNVILQVNQFNQQGEQFAITTKADTIAQKRFEVAKQRYLINKISITEMNNAQTDRDSAKRQYITALQNYWNYYYTLRQLTLYDLLFNKPLETDYDMLID